MKLAISILCALVGLGATNVGAVTLGDIDFSQKKVGQGLIFAPLKGSTSNSGVFWYTDYSQDVSPASSINSYFRKISIRATPTSHENGAYSQFVQQQSILDQRQNVLPVDATVCEPSVALTEKLTQLGINYQLEKRVGGYPGLCWLNIKYMNPQSGTAESELVDFLSQNKVIDHYYSIGGESKPAVYLDAPEIILSLVNSGVLTESTINPLDSTAYYEGDFLQVAFESSRLAANLFRSDYDVNSTLKFSDWSKFIELFSLKLSGDTSVPSQIVDQQIEIEAGSSGTTQIVVDTRSN